MPPTRTPIATYRLQLTASFGFDAATRLFPELRRLGVSHVYLSPIAEAVPGSLHGYDVVDHTRVRAELGGEDGLARLLDGAADQRLGVLIDHVPNHVSVALAQLNRPWWTMLREGADSDAARWFDVDWDAGDGKALVPKLGAPLADVIADGEVRLERFDGEPVVRYHDQLFPVAAGTADDVVLDAATAADVTAVLARQHYELMWWRDPRRNVRRFFTVDDLVAVRVEDPDVADRVDTLIDRLASHPAFDGVRIDHVDGLADPGAYLRRVRERIGDRWLLVEKILELHETLPAGWPVDGTTGYVHIVHAEQVLLDPEGETAFTGLWSATGRATEFERVEDRARREVLDEGLAPDLDRLVRLVIDRSTNDAHAPDTAVWRDAVVEVTLALDRYRTYLPDDPASQVAFTAALGRATANRPDLSDVIDAFADLVQRDAPVRTRWQQLTGPVMAKGAEDRAFYRYVPLGSLAEVGGAPGTWSIDVGTFHTRQHRLQTSWPTNLTASTTHDTKRSDAVRARSLALAAHADAWADDVTAALERASASREGMTHADDDPLAIVDRADALLALQTVVTAAPLDADRLGDYLVKATREADLHTSWTDPDRRYEGALRSLAAELIDDADDTDADDTDADDGSSRWSWLAEWVRRLASEGSTIGLRLLALQTTVPGVPDFYQGAPAELTTLVDPDNRRPPDWPAWTDLVHAADATDDERAVVEAWRRGERDAARTLLTHRLLHLRARRPDVFGRDGGYTPLPSERDGLVAFARHHRGDSPVVVTVVAPFLSSGIGEDSITFPVGRWRDLVTGATLDAGRFDAASWWTGPTTGLGVAVFERSD